MIIVTGAAGFIGSCLVSKLNQEGYQDIAVVDEFSRIDKMKNLVGKSIRQVVHRDLLFDWLSEHANHIDFVFHLGARTDTTESAYDIFQVLNVDYSQSIWQFCQEHNIPMIYASSAATYGDGQLGFDDNHDLFYQLEPLNPYGTSKNEFDKWVLQQSENSEWAGLKFFNVFGPNEYHKGRMASVIFHCYHQIKSTGQMKLFRSHRPDYADGHQKRDFIYVKDVVNTCVQMMNNGFASGIYNLGSGQANTFLDLAKFTFESLSLEPNITFIDTPEDIRDTYQYFTQANMSKLTAQGVFSLQYTFEQGVYDYVSEYLTKQKYC